MKTILDIYGFDQSALYRRTCYEYLRLTKKRVIPPVFTGRKIFKFGYAFGIALLTKKEIMKSEHIS
jgi:hypothetical protein